MKHYYFYTHHHSKINRLTSKEIYEPLHDKTNKVSVRPAKTQISQSHMNLATHWAHSEDSDQTGRMHTIILLALSCRGSYVVPWFTVSPDMEIYRGDYWFACFRVCSHSVLDKTNNENRQARCIVYGQQVQINYRSIFSGVRSITRKRNFHICKHVEANTFAAICLDCSLDTFYYTITLASRICLLWAFWL